MTLAWMDQRRCDPGFTELSREDQDDICAICPVKAECDEWQAGKQGKTPMAVRPKLGKVREGHINSSTNSRREGAQ